MKHAKFVIEIPENFASIIGDAVSVLIQANNGDSYSITLPIDPIEISSYVVKEEIDELTKEFIASADDDENTVIEEELIDIPKDLGPTPEQSAKYRKEREKYGDEIKDNYVVNATKFVEPIYPSSEPEGDEVEMTKGGYSVNATEFRRKAENREED